MGKDQKGMDVFILLDRTGSMAPLWVEAVSSVNAYVKELEKDGADDRITLAVFDAYSGRMQFDVLRNAMPIKDWKDVGDDEVVPRGTTPLLDATMRLITRAEEVGNAKTAIVVMTDGYENASKEVTKEAAKATLDRIQAKGWQVNFLGADFDGFGQAAGLGIKIDVAMNFAPGHANAAMSSTAERHRNYRHSHQQVAYEDNDRKNAGQHKVKKD